MKIQQIQTILIAILILANVYRGSQIYDLNMRLGYSQAELQEMRQEMRQEDGNSREEDEMSIKKRMDYFHSVLDRQWIVQRNLYQNIFGVRLPMKPYEIHSAMFNMLDWRYYTPLEVVYRLRAIERLFKLKLVIHEQIILPYHYEYVTDGQLIVTPQTILMDLRPDNEKDMGDPKSIDEPSLKESQKLQERFDAGVKSGYMNEGDAEND